MAKKKTSKDAIALKQCPDCGHSGDGALCRQRISHRWLEGVEEKREYEAQLDVVCCTKCGAQVLDEYARLQKHEVWCEQNGLLGPRAIRQLRRGLGLNREQFAKLLALGSASIGRWERGETVQNAANDRLLRLVARRVNVEELAQLAGVSVPKITGAATVRVAKPDGSKGEWQIKTSSYYEVTERALESERRFPLTMRIA